MITSPYEQYDTAVLAMFLDSIANYIEAERIHINDKVVRYAARRLTEQNEELKRIKGGQMSQSVGKELTPENLREIADYLDRLDEVIRTILPYYPFAAHEAKGKALAAVSDDEIQQDIRRWADHLDMLLSEPEGGFYE